MTSQTPILSSFSAEAIALSSELASQTSSLGADLLAAEAALTIALQDAFPVESVPHLSLAERDFVSLESSLYCYLPDVGTVVPPAALDAAWKYFSSLLEAWRSSGALLESYQYLASDAAPSVTSLASTLADTLASHNYHDVVIVLSSALSRIAADLPASLSSGVAVSASLAADTFEVCPASGAPYTVVVPPAPLSPQGQRSYVAHRVSGLSITEALRSL